MVDFNGSGGLAGFNPFGGAPDTYAANNAAYNANQGYASQTGMYNPFAQSGGFGAMTDYYSGLGAAYGRATGGFGGFSAQPQAQPEPQQPQYNPFQQYNSGGYNPYDAQSYAPSAQQNLGQKPPQIAIRTPGSDGANESVTYIDDPSWRPGGQGGIGSDTMRDQFAWQLAQSSPYATPGAPANGPYPNQGYNPGMANSFANPAMQQSQQSPFDYRYGASPPIDYRLQPSPSQQLPQGIYDGRFAPSVPPTVLTPGAPPLPDQQSQGKTYEPWVNAS